jgi:hypothetical protein
LHIEELHNLYCSRTDCKVIKSRNMRWEVEGSLGRPRARWDDNIKMYLAEKCQDSGLDLNGSRKGQLVGSLNT